MKKIPDSFLVKSERELNLIFDLTLAGASWEEIYAKVVLARESRERGARKLVENGRLRSKVRTQASDH